MSCKSFCLLFNDEGIILKNNKEKVEFLEVNETENLNIMYKDLVFIGKFQGDKYYTTGTYHEDNINGCIITDLDDIYDKISKKLL